MKTRILYTKFWHDNYISKLSIKEKLLFIYLTTNEQVNICGIYELPDRYIKFDLGLKQSELDKIKQKFMEDNKFIFIDGWVKIVNHDIYNKFVGEKNEKAKENEMSLIPIKIREYTYPIEGVSSFRDTLNNINHNQYKKEGGSRGGESVEKKETKRGDIFQKAWKDFKTMRTKIRKPLTERAEELIINELNKLSTDEKIQVAILNQSIMNSWQGVFPLKDRSQDSEAQPKYIPKKVPAMTAEQIARNKAKAAELAKRFSGKFNMPESNPQVVGKSGDEGDRVK